MNDSHQALLDYHLKQRHLKGREVSAKLWDMGIDMASSFLSRCRGGLTYEEVAIQQADLLDTNIWEDDAWCLGFTYEIQMRANRPTEGIKIMRHEHTPVGVNEHGFMEKLLGIEYIREREIHDANNEPV